MCPKERSPRAAWKYKKRRRRGKIGVACPLLFGKRFWKAGKYSDQIGILQYLPKGSYARNPQAQKIRKYIQFDMILLSQFDFTTYQKLMEIAFGELIVI